MLEINYGFADSNPRAELGQANSSQRSTHAFQVINNLYIYLFVVSNVRYVCLPPADPSPNNLSSLFASL